MSGGDWIPTQAPFELVRRGYSPEQVTEHLEQLEYDLRIATANRDATHQRITELTQQLSAAQAESDALRAQLDRNALEPLSVASLSDRMQRLIRLAEEEAADIRATAAKDADAQRAEMEKEAAAKRAKTDQYVAQARKAAQSAAADREAELVAEREQLDLDKAQFAAERDRMRAAANDEIRGMVDQANGYSAQIRNDAERESSQLRETARAEAEKTLLEARTAAQSLTNTANAEANRTTADATAAATEMVESAKAEAQRLERDSAAKRAVVEEDFEITIAARRTEAYRTLADRERQSVEGARRRHEESVEAARRAQIQSETEARRRIETATREADRLVTAANAEVTALSAARDGIAQQLHTLAAHLQQVQTLIGQAPGLIEPPAADQSASDPTADSPAEQGGLAPVDSRKSVDAGKSRGPRHAEGSTATAIP